MQQYRFVDRILQVDAPGTGTITTLANFPRVADYFDGTFRDEEDVPASLVLESMAFAGALLLCIRSEYTAQGVLLMVNQATFSGRVCRGDEVTVRSRLVAVQGNWHMASAPEHAGALAQTICQCLVGERLVAEGDLTFLGVPLAATLGPRREEVLAAIRRMVSAS